MVHRSWLRQCGIVNVDRPSIFHHGVINLSSIPVNKIIKNSHGMYEGLAMLTR